MGEDDERPNGQASRSVEPEIDPEDVAIELWRAVNCLHPSLRCPFTLSGCASCTTDALHATQACSCLLLLNAGQVLLGL